MLLTTYLPLAGVLLVTVGLRMVAWRRLPPRAALWTLTTIAVTGSLTVLAATAVLAGGFALGTPPGMWLIDSCSLFADHHRVPWGIGVPAILVLALSAWRIGSVLSVSSLERGLCGGPLTILDTVEPIAYARSGRRGGVVVSTGMLEVLAPAERRVLFAHERAHIRARHDLHLLAHRVAGATLPWIGAMNDEVRLAIERAADAAALAEVDGDRRLVATAIARAALAADRHGATSLALAFNGGTVGYRVQSMLVPSGRAAMPAAVTSMLGLAGALASSIFLHHLATLLEHICLP